LWLNARRNHDNRCHSLWPRRHNTRRNDRKRPASVEPAVSVIRDDIPSLLSSSAIVVANVEKEKKGARYTDYTDLG